MGECSDVGWGGWSTGDSDGWAGLGWAALHCTWGAGSRCGCCEVQVQVQVQMRRRCRVASASADVPLESAGGSRSLARPSLLLASSQLRLASNNLQLGLWQTKPKGETREGSLFSDPSELPVCYYYYLEHYSSGPMLTSFLASF